MRSIEKKLQSILFRSDCPPNMDLGEYELGILETPRRDEIASHLATCPHCQADLAQIRQFMALPAIGLEAKLSDVEEQIPLLERIKVIVVNLATPPKSFEGSILPQPVFRGAEDDTTQVVEADEYVISLTTVGDQASSSKRDMIGDIIPLTDDEDFYYWTANLWRSGKLLASTPVGADSHFIFEDVVLEDQAHELILSGPSVEIHLQNLQIA
jgi:hypothetical protein